MEVPFILGRAFLATSNALIDVNDEQMVLRVGDEKVVIKLHQAMRLVLQLMLLMMLFLNVCRKLWRKTH